MATTLNAATFMGKNFSTVQSVVKNHESLNSAIGEQSGRYQWAGQNAVGKEFLDTVCHKLMMK